MDVVLVQNNLRNATKGVRHVAAARVRYATAAAPPVSTTTGGHERCPLRASAGSTFCPVDKAFALCERQAVVGHPA